jgi:addiction module antidote protein, HigA family
MSNTIEYKGKIAFHPGYYIKEIIEESGLTQEDFAKRLDTTPKNLSILVRGEQSLTPEMALKLARMLGTSITYWINLQTAFDAINTEIKQEEETCREREVFKMIDYSYFVKHFQLPQLPRKTDEQISQLRSFLGVSTLTVFTKRDMAVSFRSSTGNISEANTVKANIMVQLAVNKAIKVYCGKFNKGAFIEKTKDILSLTACQDLLFSRLNEEFCKVGVVLVVLPNIPGSKINGATKKVGDKVVILISDRRLYSDSFWFTLYHEIGHIKNGEFGISFESEEGIIEENANRFSENMLIPPEKYQSFISRKCFTLPSIISFGKEIDRNPAIVLGRLQFDRHIRFDDTSFNSLKYRFKVDVE